MPYQPTYGELLKLRNTYVNMAASVVSCCEMCAKKYVLVVREVFMFLRCVSVRGMKCVGVLRQLHGITAI